MQHLKDHFMNRKQMAKALEKAQEPKKIHTPEEIEALRQKFVAGVGVAPSTTSRRGIISVDTAYQIFINSAANRK